MSQPFLSDNTVLCVIAAAGLTEGVIDLQSGVFCNGVKSFYKRPFHCWKAGGHGWVSLESALKYSCDIYFYELGQKLGIERIARSLSAPRNSGGIATGRSSARSRSAGAMTKF